jgi:HSP20 family molecular chaperone IbpA
MSKRKPAGKTREGLLEQIRQLEGKVRELQKGPTPGCGKTEGLAQGIAAALGRMVPGLGKLVESASQTPEFQQRLAAIDEEVKRKFKEQPLQRASLNLASGAGRRQMGIPPSLRRGRTGRSASAGAAAGESFRASGARAHGKRRGAQPPKVRISPETPAQLAVDVFDEGKAVVVLADAPGLSLEEITVSLEGNELLISVEAPRRRSEQRVELPCDVVGRPEVSLANGVLNVQVKKAGAA